MDTNALPTIIQIQTKCGAQRLNSFGTVINAQLYGFLVKSLLHIIYNLTQHLRHIHYSLETL